MFFIPEQMKLPVVKDLRISEGFLSPNNITLRWFSA